MDLTGNYELKIDSPMGEKVVSLALIIESGAIQKLELVDGKMVAKVTSPSLESNTLKFSAMMPGNPMKVTMTLDLSGDDIQGKAKMLIGEFDVVGSKVASVS